MLCMTGNDLGCGERDSTESSVVIVVSCCQLIARNAGMHLRCDTGTFVT